MQILIRPSHASLVQVSRREKIEIDPFDRAKPANILAGPYAFVVLQQPVTARITVIIECNDTVGDIDVVSQKPFGRNNALRIKAGKRRLIQEDPCKNMAGAVPEEDTIR